MTNTPIRCYPHIPYGFAPERNVSGEWTYEKTWFRSSNGYERMDWLSKHGWEQHYRTYLGICYRKRTIDVERDERIGS